jgi:serine/threonine protein kinase
MAVTLKQEARILSEIKILTELNYHPFIMRLLGRFQTRDDLVYVFERIATGTLAKLMHEPNKSTYAHRTERMDGND